MKVEMTDQPAAYAPKRLIIDLETREEAIAFQHLLACWDMKNHQTDCAVCDDVRKLAGALEKELQELRVHAD